MYISVNFKICVIHSINLKHMLKKAKYIIGILIGCIKGNANDTNHLYHCGFIYLYPNNEARNHIHPLNITQIS